MYLRNIIIVQHLYIAPQSYFVGRNILIYIEKIHQDQFVLQIEAFSNSSISFSYTIFALDFHAFMSSSLSNRFETRTRSNAEVSSLFRNNMCC
jgi:hypothetical protein